MFQSKTKESIVEFYRPVGFIMSEKGEFSVESVGLQEKQR